MVVASLREALLNQWPGRFDGAAITDDRPLGEEGLGLDSVEVLETLLALEERWAVPVTEALITDAVLTVGRVADHFAATDAHPA
jgi:acyl carrier protein